MVYQISLWLYVGYLLNFTFKTYYDNFLNFLNSIRVHVRYIVFATPQIELFHVVDYDSKSSTKFHKDCMLGIFLISLLRCHLIYIFNFQNSIRAHVRYIAFATLHIELYRVVDYDSKWSTKFHYDCMLEVLLNITFKTSYDDNFLIF